MDINKLKQQLQSIFSDGLVSIIGSGLSCAEGLPGMGALSDHLKSAMPSRLATDDEQAWTAIVAHLDAGEGLESALHKVAVSAKLDMAIIHATAEFLVVEEAKTFAECLDNGRILRFARLLPHLSPTNSKRVDVITTNYDRLIEFAAESAGWGVDTGFIGRLWGQHAPVESERSFVKAITQQGKMPKLIYRNRVRLYKPHGSLDWFETPNGAISSALPMSAPRLLITPGAGKYRRGYNQPFDSHREGANVAVDNATAFLCIGYGFNDDHLQTHLMPRLKAGVPAALITRSLSESAQAVIQQSPRTIALVCDAASGGTEAVTHQSRFVIPSVQWWNLEHFVKGVLEP